MALEFMEQQEQEQPQQELPRQNIWDTKEYLEFVKHYSEDENIPIGIKGSNWANFSKSLLYTFLEEKDLAVIDSFSTIFRIDCLISKPAHRITLAETYNLDQIQFHTYLQAKRAIGTNREKMNERTLQNTQIAQSIATQTANVRKAGGGGFFSKLRRVF